MSHSDRHSHKYLVGLFVAMGLVFSMVLSACTGPSGSQGVQGPPGPPGSSGPAGPTAPSEVACIVAIPASGLAGAGIKVLGSGFEPGGEVWLEIDANFKSSGITGHNRIAMCGRTAINESGALNIATKIPNASVPGTYTINALASNGAVATCPVTVLEKE